MVRVAASVALSKRIMLLFGEEKEAKTSSKRCIEFGAHSADDIYKPAKDWCKHAVCKTYGMDGAWVDANGRTGGGEGTIKFAK